MKNTTLYVGNKPYKISISILSLMNSLVKENQYEWKLNDVANNKVYESSIVYGVDLKRKLIVNDTITKEREIYFYSSIEEERLIIESSTTDDYGIMFYVNKLELVNNSLFIIGNNNIFIVEDIDSFNMFLETLSPRIDKYYKTGIDDNNVIEDNKYIEYLSVTSLPIYKHTSTYVIARAMFKVDDLFHEVNGEYKPREIEDIIKIVSERTL